MTTVAMTFQWSSSYGHISLSGVMRPHHILQVATMAIEKVYIHNNTSLIQDEVSHTHQPHPPLLSPIFGCFPPRCWPTDWGSFQLRQILVNLRCYLHVSYTFHAGSPRRKAIGNPIPRPASSVGIANIATTAACAYYIVVEEDAQFPDPSPEHMLDFRLKVKCTRNPKAPKNSQDPNELYLHCKGNTPTVSYICT